MVFMEEINRTHLSAKDYAYEMIKSKIWQFDLPPGGPISEEQLGKSLNISRTPLREAISILEHEKLIERQPNKRLKVSELSIKEAKEIFSVRSALESIAVREAVLHSSEADYENLSLIVTAISQMSIKHNREQLLQYGEKFHQYIYQMSQNETIKTILQGLHNHVRRYRFLIISQKANQAEAEDEHKLIFEAMKAGQADLAVKIMQTHLEESLSLAIEALENYQMEVDI